MARPPSADSILRNTKKEIYEPVTPIGTELILPNYSGIKTAGGKLKGDGSALTGLSSIPIGTIVMYGKSSAPAGWLLCNGDSYDKVGDYSALFAVIQTTFGSTDANHFSVPDMQGIFPRGFGTSTKLTNAGGTAFAGVLGTYQNDKFQGHFHTFASYDANHARGSDGYVDETRNNPTSNNYSNRVVAAITDGTNAVPRTGAETNPANLGLNFIIKY